MKMFMIEITLDSHSVIGSGEGFGAVIDADIVFDDIGLPYIPAKRIKGCLREAAQGVQVMLQLSGLPAVLELENTFGTNPALTKRIEDKPERLVQGSARFSNLYLDKYQENRNWLAYLTAKHNSFVSKETILNTFTSLRQHTKIYEETGVADDHSLRTTRVLNRGRKFYGKVIVEADNVDPIESTLALACANLRRIGTKRNRGFGEVTCCLLDEQRQAIPVLPLLHQGGEK